jgi:hypothetical protein
MPTMEFIFQSVHTKNKSRGCAVSLVILENNISFGLCLKVCLCAWVVGCAMFYFGVIHYAGLVGVILGVPLGCFGAWVTAEHNVQKSQRVVQ